MTNAFTIDRSKVAFIHAMDKNNHHRQLMTKWVNKQRDDGKEPCRVEMPKSPENKKVK